MLHEFKQKEIPLEVFTIEDKQYLLNEDYIHLTSEGYLLTQKGLDFVSRDPETKVIVKYPMTKTGRVGSYNKVLRSMSEEAANALMCSMITTGFMEKVNTSNTRVFVQHLLDNNNHRKWGNELVSKYHDTLSKSLDYFKKNKRVSRKS